jgi:Rrf2 family protein
MANIINFSEAASIGLHGMILIAKSDKPLNAIQLSNRLGKSKHHIGKVLQRLVKEGFLDSFRGPTGGFSMKADPAQVKLLDIYTAIEGKIVVKRCEQHHKICPAEKCIFDNVTSKMTEDFIKHMNNEILIDYL